MCYCDFLVSLDGFIICTICFITPSLIILYCDDYMFGDLNVFRFIVLVLVVVVSKIFVIN